MFGTVARLHPKPGEEQAVAALVEEWDREHRRRAKGAKAGYLFRSESNSGEYLLVAIFQDRQTYEANAQAPEQDQWYRKLRNHLTEDPRWEDGEIVSHFPA